MTSKLFSFDWLPLHFVLLMGCLVLVVAVVNAYGTNNPSVFGHSSDEIEYAFAVYERDCSSQMIGFCNVACSPGETAVSGSCETSRGWGHLAIGTIDGTTFECSDASFDPNATDKTLIARVVCLS